MPFIYALINQGMPELVKFLYSNAAVGELLYELDKRAICVFESPYQYTIACYFEVLDESSSTRLYVAMNKCNFERLRDNFYNVKCNINAVVNLFKQLSLYEQLILDEIHKKNNNMPYKKLSLFIDNAFVERENHESVVMDEIASMISSNEHSPRKTIPSRQSTPKRYV